MCNSEKCCVVSKFCCGCKLRTGCLVYGWFQVVMSIAWNAVVIILLALSRGEVAEPISITNSIVSLLVGMVIIIGTYEKKRLLLWIVFYFQILWNIFYNIPAFVYAILYLHSSGFLDDKYDGAGIYIGLTGVILGPLGSFCFLMSIYFLIVLRSFIHEIESEYRGM